MPDRHESGSAAGEARRTPEKEWQSKELSLPNFALATSREGAWHELNE